MMEPDLELKRWTRAEYEQLIAQGVFMPDGRVARALAHAFGPEWDVRTQGPVALDDTSEPEPDVAVVRGDIRDYTTAHPTDPVLVVEVTFSSVALDRRYKSSLYARARRPEYWVLNLIDHVLEVRR